MKGFIIMLALAVGFSACCIGSFICLFDFFGSFTYPGDDPFRPVASMLATIVLVFAQARIGIAMRELVGGRNGKSR